MCVVPSPPLNLRLQLIQENPPAVTVTWQIPRTTFGDIKGFRLTFGVKGQPTLDERPIEGHKFSFTTSFLEHGALYEFRLAAKNSVDYGEAAVEMLKTPDGRTCGVLPLFV